MASKYLRRSHWWIQFYHPVTRALIRESLDTSDEARAELLRERLDHEVALLDPRYQAVELPPRVREIVAGRRTDPSTASTVHTAAPCPTPLAAAPVPGRSLDEALVAYINFIRIENDAHHVANKLSILRRFFGNSRIGCLGAPLKLRPEKNVARRRRSRSSPVRRCMKSGRRSSSNSSRDFPFPPKPSATTGRSFTTSSSSA